MSYFGLPLYPTTLPTQQAVVSITGTTTLGAGAATYDKQFLITGAGGYTITLPAIDATNFPSRFFTIFNNSSALCTVTAAGSDTMLLLGSSFSSISILPGERFLVQNMATSWVVALESASRTTTAPQFDSTIRSASTAFVQRALGNFSSTNSISAATTLTAANAGQFVQCFGSSTYTVTLPVASTMTAGSAITFFATQLVTIARQGSNSIQMNASAAVTSITLQAGDSITLSCDGSAIWYPSGGSAQLPYSSQFGFLQATNGYQKFPGGNILQWGATSSVTTGTSVTVTLPLAMPTAILQVVTTFQASNNGTAPASAGWQALTNSTFTLRNISTLTGQYSWMAVGY